MTSGLDRETLELSLEAFRDFATEKLPDDVLLDLDERDVFPVDLVRELCGSGLGIQLLFIDEEYGGMGLGHVAMAAVAAEAAKTRFGPFAMNAQAPDEGNMHTMLHFATDEQKEKYMRPLVNGECRSCFAMTEPEVAGSDPEVGAVHAGLECGIIGEKYPGMDMISVGPQIEFPHSPDERIKVGTVPPFFKTSVLICGNPRPEDYELRLAGETVALAGKEPHMPPATNDELEYFYAHLEQVLTDISFLDPDNPRVLMRRLRRMFIRSRPDKNEVNILRGFLTAVDRTRETK